MENVNEKQAFGHPLPDFTLRDLAGSEVNLASALRGKKGAVVVIWSSTCSHCVRYDGYFNKFSENHPDLAFIALASRHGETAESVKKAAKERGIQFPIALDPGGTVAAQWYTNQTPRAFLVDKEARLLYRGAVCNFKYAEDPEYVPYLEPAIADLLAERPVARTETASFGCAIQSVYYILPRSL
ncbi:MAG TPA: redoxin family protein [Bryobacteraceae bacterium]|nr:redoxin family protein [Bryobacteraceae bacterium]